jgi:hypothetical protein
MAETQTTQDTAARIKKVSKEIRRLEEERLQTFFLLGNYFKRRAERMHHFVAPWKTLAEEFPENVRLQHYAKLVDEVAALQVERDQLRVILCLFCRPMENAG